VNDDLEAGAKAVFGKGKSSASIEVAAKYQLDRGSFVKAKVNNEGTLGLGYTFNLAAGLKLAVAGLFDANKMSTEANNVGFHITYEG
jgi:voltage-dependent anion channel protein 2